MGFVRHLRSARLIAFVAVLASHATLPCAFAREKKTDPLQQLIEWELQGNPHRDFPISTKPFWVEHIEIPLRYVEADLAKDLDADIQKALIFVSNGKKTLRWIIHPGDSNFGPVNIQQIENKNGTKFQRKKYFRAWNTASRSLILEDPVSKVVFSVKVPTSLVHGSRQYKNLEAAEVIEGRAVTEWLKVASSAWPSEHFIFQEEVAAFWIDHPSINQGMLVRSLKTITESDNRPRYYLPGFSALHEKVGIQIAKKNGANTMKEVATFWKNHLMTPVAKAVAELAIKYGLTYDSPHPQNYLLELDQNFFPTGRVLFRDIQDTFASRNFFEAANPKFLKKWRKNYISDRLNIFIQFVPKEYEFSWINKLNPSLGALSPDHWGKYDFFKAFDEAFLDIVGSDFKQTVASVHHYMYGTYVVYFGQSKTDDTSLSGVRPKIERIEGIEGIERLKTFSHSTIDENPMLKLKLFLEEWTPYFKAVRKRYAHLYGLNPEYKLPSKPSGTGDCLTRALAPLGAR